MFNKTHAQQLNEIIHAQKSQLSPRFKFEKYTSSSCSTFDVSISTFGTSGNSLEMCMNTQINPGRGRQALISSIYINTAEDPEDNCTNALRSITGQAVIPQTI